MSDDVPELTAADFARAMPAQTRRRLAEGHIACGDDVAAIRRFVGLTIDEFAEATGASVDVVRGWESGTRPLDGPTIRLLRIAVRHPGVFREGLRSAV